MYSDSVNTGGFHHWCSYHGSAENRHARGSSLTLPWASCVTWGPVFAQVVDYRLGYPGWAIDAIKAGVSPTPYWMRGSNLMDIYIAGGHNPSSHLMGSP